MYWDRIEVNWKQFKGRAKEQWSMLGEEELERVQGKRDRLSAQIQEAYGVSHDEAEKRLSEWQRCQRLEPVS
jgi:uncharacterized protein YjbJ (UPF0337 family)